MNGQETLELVDQISAAFAAHDIDAMVSYFAEDGAFVNAIGPDHFGTCYTGHAAIRSYFEPLFAGTSDVRWDKLDIRVAGDKAYAEWRRTATLASGEKQDWLGIDVYEEEADLFCRHVPALTERVTYVRNGIDTEHYSLDSHHENPFDGDEPRVVFTGMMDYWANVDAVTWFAKEVFPRVRIRVRIR